MLSRLGFINSTKVSFYKIERICLNGVRNISTLKEVPGALSQYLNNCTLKQPNYSSELGSYSHEELLYSLQSLPNTRLKGLNERDLNYLINNPEFTGQKLELKEINVENADTNELLTELSMLIKENKLKDQLIWKELVNSIEISNRKYLEWNGLNGSINPIIKPEGGEKYLFPITKSMEEIVESNEENINNNSNIIISDKITNVGLVPYSIYKYINNNNNNEKKMLEVNMNDKIKIEIELPTKDLSVKYNTKTATIPNNANAAITTSITESITRIIMNDNTFERISNLNEIHFISFNKDENIKSSLSKDILQRCRIYSINNVDLNTFIKCMNKSKTELKIEELYLENYLDISNQKLSLYSDIKSVLPRGNRDLEYEVDHLNKQLKNIMDFVTKNVEDKNVISSAYEKIMRECNISRVLNVENLFTKQSNVCRSYDDLISLSDRELEELDTISFGTDENINSSKFEEILKVLPKIPNLKAIEILKSDIIDPDLLEFDEYLKTNLKLEKLKIVSHKLSFLSFSSLLTNINPHIKELSLSSDLYNDAVTLILNNHIPKLPDLERLELYGYKLSANELEKVYVNVEAYCPNMKYLALPYVKSLKSENNAAIGRYGIHNYEIGFTDATITVPEMGELYDMHPNLQFQFLECLGLNNGNVKEFANNLKINKNLNHLFINEGSISADNINYLFDRIDKSKIEVLSFKNCKFDKTDILKLCERIDEFENVDDLEIENCNLETTSLSILLTKIKSLKKIRRLNIAELEIDDDIIKVLRSFRTISPIYESLAIGNDTMNPELLVDLLGSELFNKTKVLTFKKMNIKMHQTHKVFNDLESMPKLEFVILDNCKTDYDMMKQVKELNLKYEIVQPKPPKKNNHIMLTIFLFLVIYLMSASDRGSERNKRLNNNNNKENLPNNNGKRIQGDNENGENYLEDDGYNENARIFLEEDDNRVYLENNYRNNDNSNRFTHSNSSNRRDGYLLQDNNNDYYDNRDTEEDKFTIDDYSGGSSPHGFNR